MPKRVNTIPQVDFQGGLNLNANALQLAENESPMLLNVDLDRLGGFRRRPAVREVHRFDVDVYRLLTAVDASDQVWLVALCYGGIVKYSTDGITWVQIVVAAGFLEDMEVFSDGVYGTPNYAYLQSGNNGSTRWQVGTANQTVLTNTFNNVFDVAPLSGNFVKGTLVCRHKEFMFTAGTYTDGYRPNRIHFSHPGNAEAWRTLDWFDVGDAEPITAIVSFQDSLYIFKEDSVWELQGYDFETFSLSNLSHGAGATNAKSVAVSPGGVYFYSWPYGVYFLGANGLEYKSAKLEEYLVEKQVEPRLRGESLVWMNKRLFFSVADYPSVDVLWKGIGPTFTFVLDPLLPNDSWTLYGFPVEATTTYGDPYYRGGTSGLSDGVAFKSDGTFTDNVGFAVLEESYRSLVRFVRTEDHNLGDYISVNGVGTYKPIESYYMTGWQDLDNAAVVKSWGRPVVVMGGMENAILEFEVFKDYDSANKVRSFSLSSDVSLVASLPWGTAVWDDGTGLVGNIWTVPADSVLGIKKGGRIGRATAVAMKVKCLEQTKTWSVDSIVWKYIPKRVRS